MQFTPILRCILLFFHPTWAVPREGLYLIKTARQTKIDAALQTSNTIQEVRASKVFQYKCNAVWSALIPSCLLSSNSSPQDSLADDAITLSNERRRRGVSVCVCVCVCWLGLFAGIKRHGVL